MRLREMYSEMVEHRSEVIAMPLLWTARKAVIKSDDPYIDAILLFGLIVIVVTVIWAVITIIKMNKDDGERK